MNCAGEGLAPRIVLGDRTADGADVGYCPVCGLPLSAWRVVPIHTARKS